MKIHIYHLAQLLAALAVACGGAHGEDTAPGSTPLAAAAQGTPLPQAEGALENSASAPVQEAEAPVTGRFDHLVRSVSKTDLVRSVSKTDLVQSVSKSDRVAPLVNCEQPSAPSEKASPIEYVDKAQFSANRAIELEAFARDYVANARLLQGRKAP